MTHRTNGLAALCALLLLSPQACRRERGAAAVASESGTLQIDSSDRTVYVLNRGLAHGSLSVFRVRDGAGRDAAVKISEIDVGAEPESVSVTPDGRRAYVSNGAEGTVSVIDVAGSRVLDVISVGSEPRGTALSPTGRTLYVANFSDGTLSVIDTAARRVTNVIDLTEGPRPILNPFAVTVSHNGNLRDSDETIYVTDFFGRTIPGTPVERREGFDDAKEGRVACVSAATETVLAVAVLSPMASGFAADRSQFDPAVNPAAKPGNPYIAPPGVPANAVPQKAFFNQLYAISADPETGLLYVNAIGAQPEPPAKFNVNVQALVGVIDPVTAQERTDLHVNLNALVKVESQPAPPFNGSLTRAFMADTVDACIRAGRALFISRAGSYALQAGFDGDGRLALGNSAATPALRHRTGQIPHGVVMNQAGTRAYVNGEVDATLTTIDLDGAAVLERVPSSELPPPGGIEHNALIGKLIFHTGMGVDPGVRLVGTDVRTIDTHRYRNIASDNNWSSCASCHYRGTTDNVTWSFPTGPRQTLSLDASFSRANPQVQRVFNWNAVRGSVTDFNNNIRGVQGGFGFTPQALAHLDAGGSQATVPDRGLVFNHGRSSGVSDALDLQTLWVQGGVRTLNAPSRLDPDAVARGRAAFQALSCQSCHGGDQWTASRVRWASPLFASDPVASSPTPHTPLDDRVQNLNAVNPANGQFVGTVLRAFDASLPPDGVFETPIVTRFTGDPTLDLNEPNEIRGAGAQIGQGSVGGGGSFNPPSLLMLAGTAPYGHHGRAGTLRDVFGLREEGGLGHPTFGATPEQLADLVEFLRSIDGRSPPVP